MSFIMLLFRVKFKAVPCDNEGFCFPLPLKDAFVELKPFIGLKTQLIIFLS